MKEPRDEEPRMREARAERDEMEEGKRSDVEKVYARNEELRQLEKEAQAEQDRYDDTERAFIDFMEVMMNRAHGSAVEKGWWDDHNSILIALKCDETLDSTYIKAFEDAWTLSKIALMHSELSEAVEGIRDKSGKPDQHLPQYSQTTVEFADVIIRIFDVAKKLELPLPQAIVDKMKYNATRPYKHGKKI